MILKEERRRAQTEVDNCLLKRLKIKEAKYSFKKQQNMNRKRFSYLTEANNQVDANVARFSQVFVEYKRFYREVRVRESSTGTFAW